MSLTEERRQKLLADLKVCKEQGLRAFINKKDSTSVWVSHRWCVCHWCILQ